MGRWSRQAAREFLQWLTAPPGSDWLDVGCGTGALTQSILDQTRPASVRSIDPSPGFIAHARSHVSGDRAHFAVADARALPFAAAGVAAAVAGLVLNFVPRPAHAVAEMARVTRPGGHVAAYVWDYGGRMEFLQIFWASATELDPAAGALDEGPRFPICRPEPLARLFRDAGLRDVAVRPIDVPTDFRDFDDYWSPFLGGQGVAPAYVMSLDVARREALRDLLRARLHIAVDGAIRLVARAWAVRGRTS